MSINIKIFVSFHKLLYFPSHPLLFPIQVGATLTDKRFDGMLYDNTGENISSKNRSYCELTAQYWAWKNDEADYFGFFHYRRYLSFDKKNVVEYPTMPKKLPRAYKIYGFPDEKTLDMLGFCAKDIEDIISCFDVIAPVAEEMYVSVYDHYKNTKYHDSADLDLVLKIISEKYPEFMTAAIEYTQGTRHYFCNIFIMKREYFYEYCKWLFDILEVFDSQTDFSKYSNKALRVDGYLGERLFGIYFTWLKKQTHLRCAELPRVHFEAFPGETDNFSRMKRINAILPPDTRRRAIVKKLLNDL